VAAQAASEAAEEWDKMRMVHLRDLQDAARNGGKVQLVRDTHREELLAAKRMPRSWVQTGPAQFAAKHPDASEQPWLDIALVRLLSEDLEYPYVCRLRGVFFHGLEEIIVTTTFCDSGDLFEWVYREDIAPPGLEREARMRPIVAQCLSAVRWLHDLGVSHRDVSLENVMMVGTASTVQVKLIDFGMASLRRVTRNEVRGKSSYQAPEMHIQDHATDTFLSDIFAVGVLVYTMAAQDYPWGSTRPGGCQLFEYVSLFGLSRFLGKRRLRSSRERALRDVMTQELVDFLASLLQLRPGMRGCLGEATFDEEHKCGRRASVWDLAWLRGADEELPYKYKLAPSAGLGVERVRSEVLPTLSLSSGRSDRSGMSSMSCKFSGFERSLPFKRQNLAP